MKKADKCVHYTGIVKTICAAGVKYEDVVDKTTKPFSYPCLGLFNKDGVAKCDKCQLPTAEEVAADEAWVAKRLEGIGKAREAIVAHLGGPWKKGMGGGSGRITCPVCGQADALAFSRAGYNGHVHAACKTTGCVSWME